MGVIFQDYQLIDNSADIVVDGIFGTGLDRVVSGKFAAAIAYINQLSVPVLAIDIPSGLNADTGNVMGYAINATMTLTFIVLKKGLFTGLAVATKIYGGLISLCIFAASFLRKTGAKNQVDV